MSTRDEFKCYTVSIPAWMTQDDVRSVVDALETKSGDWKHKAKGAREYVTAELPDASEESVMSLKKISGHAKDFDRYSEVFHAAAGAFFGIVFDKAEEE